MRSVLKSLLFVITITVLAASEELVAAEAAQDLPDRPNLVWIWADNLAYGDLSCYGSDHVRTPVIDRLAAEGARFTQYYIAHVVCSPSRAALLTGRQPFRTGIVAVLRPDGPSGIHEDEITLAEALRERGYATQAIGKWHLGDRRQYLPTQHGFDHYLGIPYSMDMLPTILIRDNDVIEDLVGSRVENITERYTDEAIRFVEANRDEPFFLYFSHTIPHPPLNLPERLRTPDRPIYDDAIEHMDAETGRLLDAIDRAGLRERTLVIFSSDNGPMNRGGDTGGLRGRIGQSYEGGVRVPMVANWPGVIPSGQVVETPAIAYDVFPTFVHLAGGELAGDRVYDGQDIWPLLAGGGDFNREKPFVWVYTDNVTAVRSGRWKLHVAHRDATLPEPELYDLSQDPKETKSVTADHPRIVAKLQQAVAEMQAQVPMVWSLTYPVRDQARMPSGVRRE